MLKAVTINPKHTMALKVTALTYLPVLKAFNAGQRKLYEMFVELGGYDFNASITKTQVKTYLKTKYGMDVEDAEIDEFFKVGKIDSTDTDPNRLTAVEYSMNIHAYPVYGPLKNPLAEKIANIDSKTVAELNDWIKRVHSILEYVKKADV